MAPPSLHACLEPKFWASGGPLYFWKTNRFALARVSSKKWAQGTRFQTIDNYF